MRVNHEEGSELADPSEYEADIGTAIEDLRALNERLLRHGRIPALATITAIDSASQDEIAGWLSAEFGLQPDEARARLEGRSESVNFCPQLSFQFAVGSELIGAILSYRASSPRTAYLYAIVIRKHWRNSWCAPFFKYHSLIRIQGEGIERVRFQAYRGNRDTQKHAARVGAKVVPP